MFDFLQSITAIPTVSGHEAKNANDIAALCMRHSGGFFSECEISPVGSIYLVHPGQDGAGHLMLDAHLDTIGFVVSELCEGGFLRVQPVGGVDRRILPGCEITLYGKQAVRGLFVATPPHLASASGDKELPGWRDLTVDTGLSDERLAALVPVGTPAGFSSDCERLASGRMAGKSLDDKACIAAIVRCGALLSGTLASDTLVSDTLAGGAAAARVTACFSVGEETSSLGAVTAAYAVKPDAAVVLDVNYARTPGDRENQTLVMGQGPGVSYSVTTSRALTDAVVETAKAAGLACQTVVETKSTGTNAHALQCAHSGTPCAVVSIPLKYMHTYSECIDLADVEATAALLAEFVRCFPQRRCVLAPAISTDLLCKGGDCNG